MIVVPFKKVSHDLEARKAMAKKLEESIQASRKVFDRLLTPRLAQAFGVDLTAKDLLSNKEGGLRSVIWRDLAQQPRARKMTLQEILLQEGFQGWFVDKESLLVIMAVCWYDLVKKYHEGKYQGTKLEHRQMIMFIQVELHNQLALRVEKTQQELGTGAAEQELEAFNRFHSASDQAFNSIPKMEQELGLRDAPPKSRRRGILKSDATTPDSVDFSRTA